MQNTQGILIHQLIKNVIAMHAEILEWHTYVIFIWLGRYWHFACWHCTMFIFIWILSGVHENIFLRAHLQSGSGNRFRKCLRRIKVAYNHIYLSSLSGMLFQVWWEIRNKNSANRNYIRSINLRPSVGYLAMQLFGLHTICFQNLSSHLHLFLLQKSFYNLYVCNHRCCNSSDCSSFFPDCLS